MTLIHSLPLTPSSPPCRAMAPPVRPAISAWLSLVGIPKYQARTAHTTMAKRAALKATMASWELVPKSTIFVMVSATVAFSILMRKTPRKLKTAAIRIAALTGMHRVTTQVAIAFGASVHPLTRITPSVSRTAISSRGLDVTCARKYSIDKSITTSENIENKNSLRKKREGSPADRKIQEASPGDRIIIA